MIVMKPTSLLLLSSSGRLLPYQRFDIHTVSPQSLAQRRDKDGDVLLLLVCDHAPSLSQHTLGRAPRLFSSCQSLDREEVELDASVNRLIHSHI